MNLHPDKKQLIDALLGSANDKAAAAAVNHIKDCKECAKTAESLLTILHPSDNSAIYPPARIKENLFSAPEIPGRKIPFPGRALKIFLRPAVAAAIVVVAVVSFIIVFSLNREAPPLYAALNLQRHSGSIIYNNTRLSKDSIEINSGNIKTENNSSALLGLEPAFSVKIAEGTDISLTGAKEFTENGTKKYSISIDMKAGTIMVSSNHDIIKMYAITTPHAVFEPAGTAFILSSDSASSKLSVIEGSVKVSPKEQKSTFRLNKGEGGEINAAFKKRGIDPEKAAGNFNGIFNKNRVHQEAVKRQQQKPQQEPESKDGYRPEIKESPGEDGNARKDSEKEMRKDKNELRGERKQMQKEMRDERRQGKGSRR